MTSKIVVNNIEADAGVSTVFFNSDIGATDGTLNIDGNLTVDGVITYEDVTSVDAVGLSTFQNGIHVTGGTVGIGTDNPGVAGIDILANSAAVRCRESGGADARLVSGGSISYFGTYSNHDLQILTNGSNALRITSNGKIGIGLTNPQNLLHIKSGASGASSYDARYKLILENSGEQYIGFYNNDNSYSGIRFNNTTSIIGSIDYYYTDNHLLYYGNGGHVFQTIGGGTVEKVRITSTGNVGIGTNNPGTKLDILNGSDASVIATINGANNSSEYLGLGINGSDAIITGGGNGSTSTNLVFRTAASGTEIERLRITSGGYIGVGTDFTPQKTLHLRDSNTSGVQGNVQLRIEKGVGQSAAPDSISRNNCYIHLGGSEWGDGSNGHYLIGFGYSNGEVGSAIPAYIGYNETTIDGYTNGDLIFGTRTSISGSDNPIERMRIHDNGYVEGHRHPIESGSTIRQQDGSGSGAATGWVAVNSTTWDWDPNDSHYISCTFEGYIQSGTYWWTWRLYNSTRSEYLIPFLGANRLDNTSGYGSIAYIGSVHSYSRQPYVAFKKSANTQTGDTIQLQLHASSGGGNILYTNASQTLYARYITFHAGVATGGSTL